MRKFFRQQAAYGAHPDPATRAINLVALVLAWNGPFYPAYVIALLGRAGLGSLLTMLASPFFYAVPWIARRHAGAGRIALPVFGILNTLYCVKLFGPNAGIKLFFIPCILLTALLFRRAELAPRWLLIGAAILPFWLPGRIYGAPILHFGAPALAKLAELNLLSVASLSGLIALRFAGVFRELAAAPAGPPV